MSHDPISIPSTSNLVVSKDVSVCGAVTFWTGVGGTVERNCHGIYCPTRMMSGGQNMAAIFGPGQNMADTFSPGGQNVAARFSPTLQYMVRARTIRGISF